MYNAMNSKNVLYSYNSKKFRRKAFHRLNIHIAKPVGVARYNFNFHGTRVVFKHSKIHEWFLHHIL